MADLESLYEAILKGKLDVAKAVTTEAIAENVDPQLIINEYMSRAMEDMAARAMKGALDLLKPLMKGAASHRLGKVVIGTVKGDLHDIGKNLVASMLEGCGFEVINLGTDISSEKFITAIKENQAQILCLSALLTTTMNYMQEVIDALEKTGIRQEVKVMIGGAPVSESFARQIGADGYSDNANAAVTLAKSLLSA